MGNKCELNIDTINDYTVREARNILIAMTDRYALSDQTMTTEMSAYRQALRDITAQAGFPTEVIWPTKP